MVVNRAMKKAKRRASIREMEKAKMTEKESAIKADRQVAMEAMRVNDGQRSTAGGSPSQGSVMMMRSWTGLRVGNRLENVSSERSGDLTTAGAAPKSPGD